jgi:hypothetical protein
VTTFNYDLASRLPTAVSNLGATTYTYN